MYPLRAPKTRQERRAWNDVLLDAHIRFGALDILQGVAEDHPFGAAMLMPALDRFASPQQWTLYTHFDVIWPLYTDPDPTVGVTPELQALKAAVAKALYALTAQAAVAPAVRAANLAQAQRVLWRVVRYIRDLRDPREAQHAVRHLEASGLGEAVWFLKGVAPATDGPLIPWQAADSPDTFEASFYPAVVQACCLHGGFRTICRDLSRSPNVHAFRMVAALLDALRRGLAAPNAEVPLLLKGTLLCYVNSVVHHIEHRWGQLRHVPLPAFVADAIHAMGGVVQGLQGLGPASALGLCDRLRCLLLILRVQGAAETADAQASEWSRCAAETLDTPDQFLFWRCESLLTARPTDTLVARVALARFVTSVSVRLWRWTPPPGTCSGVLSRKLCRESAEMQWTHLDTGFFAAVGSLPFMGLVKPSFHLSPEWSFDRVVGAWRYCDAAELGTRHQEVIGHAHRAFVDGLLLRPAPPLGNTTWQKCVVPALATELARVTVHPEQVVQVFESTLWGHVQPAAAKVRAAAAQSWITRPGRWSSTRAAWITAVMSGSNAPGM